MEFPRGRTPLTQDDTPIEAIYWPGEGAGGHKVGELGITNIIAYDENGDMAYVPWLAVFRNDKLIMRCPAKQVSVHYADPAITF